tara:strand:+ start:1306 stop:1530 length:225 start_codon:yes stop_codon:yes gene_type:complete
MCQNHESKSYVKNRNNWEPNPCRKAEEVLEWGKLTTTSEVEGAEALMLGESSLSLALDWAVRALITGHGCGLNS